MSTATPPVSAERPIHSERPVHTEPTRLSTETKGALKTSEFFIWLAAVIGIIVTSAVVGASDGARVDPFGAFQALQLITFVTIGYLVARGLAKSGSRERYTDTH